ncbi:MAG: threonine synthase [bacterium]
MNNYIFKCSSCGKTFDKNKIESELIYLCPDCGRIEDNLPLHGVLLIEYVYDEIRKSIDKELFLKQQPGKFWLHDYLWPIECSKGKITGLDENLQERISLRPKFLHEISIEGKSFHIFDDTRNPTFSFKDRASILVAVKALQLGIKEISAASTGNAGSSIAGICAMLGLNTHVFVPKNIPDAKRIQIQSYGANIYIVNGNYDAAFDLCFEISNHKKWFNRNTAFNPLTIEGKKSAAYDIFLETKGILPENIIVPVGDGVIISGLYKGFWELQQLGWIEKIPKLIAVQAEGSDALVRFLSSGKFEYKPAHTIADSISAGVPRCLYLAVEAVQKSHGFAMTVTDEEILFAQREIIQKTGIFIEPSCSTTYAALQKISDNGTYQPEEKYLLMFTGNGLKDISALSSWNKKAPVKSCEEWKEHFGL